MEDFQEGKRKYSFKKLTHSNACNRLRNRLNMQSKKCYQSPLISCIKEGKHKNINFH